MIREIFGEPLDNGPLGTLVGLGDQVRVAFVGDARRAGEFLAEDLAGFLGDFDGGFEIVFGHGGWLAPGLAGFGVRGRFHHFTIRSGTRETKRCNDVRK